MPEIIFGNQSYYRISRHNKKSEATKKAKYMRSRGYFARVVRSINETWDVYLRDKVGKK